MYVDYLHTKPISLRHRTNLGPRSGTVIEFIIFLINIAAIVTFGCEVNFSEHRKMQIAFCM